MMHTVFLLINTVIVLDVLYLYLIMPRIPRRHDETVFKKGSLFAHRGLFDNAAGVPENSLRAFEKAAAMGVGIELDVQLSADGVPVVFHDAALTRMCGEEQKVTKLSLSELKKYSLLDTDETIPTLEEALGVIRGRVPLLVEIKMETASPEVCRKADRILSSYSGPYCMESFNPFACLWYRIRRPQVLRGQLSDGFYRDAAFRRPKYYAFAVALSFLLLDFLSRPDFIAYNYDYKNNISRRLCRRLFRGWSAAWTIKSEEQLEKAAPHFDVCIFDSFMPSQVAQQQFG